MNIDHKQLTVPSCTARMNFSLLRCNTSSYRPRVSSSNLIGHLKYSMLGNSTSFLPFLLVLSFVRRSRICPTSA